MTKGLGRKVWSVFEGAKVTLRDLLKKISLGSVEIHAEFITAAAR